MLSEGMKPHRTSALLIRLADSIDRAKAPDPNLVASHLRKIIAAIENPFTEEDLRDISASFRIDTKKWEVTHDYHPEEIVTYAEGQGFITVDNVDVPVNLTGGYMTGVDVEIDFRDDSLDWPDDWEHEQMDAWLDKYANADWSKVEARLEKDHGTEVHDSASNAIFDAEDAASYERDPYEYYGLRRSDFI